MNRRQILKNITVLGALSLIPGMDLLAGNKTKKIHFIGLGSGGTNVLKFIHQRERNAKFTCITSPDWEPVNDINHIQFKPENRRVNFEEVEKFDIQNYPEIIRLLNQDDDFILLASLGGMTGTMLTRGVNNYLSNRNHRTYTIYCVPFTFEDKKSQELARFVKIGIDRLGKSKGFQLDDMFHNQRLLPISDAVNNSSETFYSLYKEIRI